ncbi:MAG: hypothetical protein ACI857_001850 [Arenicella sp.]|jgi:hypothetical protein
MKNILFISLLLFFGRSGLSQIQKAEVPAAELETGEKQHDILDQTLESWKGELEQLDDICIIGIRF